MRKVRASIRPGACGVGRQGQGSRTHLVSPAMAAAAAVTGRFTDVREMVEDL